MTEVRDVAPGLWLWRVRHPDWAPDSGWEPLVTSTCVESGGEVIPGGFINPDILRTDGDAVAFVAEFFEGVHAGQRGAVRS